MIIGIAGNAGAGKSTLARAIQESFYLYEFGRTGHFSQIEIKAFADPVKEIITSILYSHYTEDLENLKRSNYPVLILKDSSENKKEHLQYSYRQLLVKVAEMFKENFHPKIWASITLDNLVESVHYIIPDVRFTYEKEMIEKLGGVVIRIVSEYSEEDMKGVPYSLFESPHIRYAMEVDNHGTINDLNLIAEKIVKTYL